jgi:hypothetical protein
MISIQHIQYIPPACLGHCLAQHSSVHWHSCWAVGLPRISPQQQSLQEKSTLDQQMMMDLESQEGFSWPKK